MVKVEEEMPVNLKKSIIVLFKTLLYSLLFAVFFVVFSFRNVGLMHLSRTMVVTMMTFVVFGAVMLSVYGNFKIGEEKSKPVFYATFLAVLMTDLFTYVQLMIMNTNPNNNLVFKLMDLDLLLLVIVIQAIIIWCFSYLGNLVYFKMFKPLKTIIVYDEKETTSQKVKNVIKRYQLQYDLLGTYNAYDTDIYEAISVADYVILLDMSETKREELIRICYHKQTNFSYLPTITSIVQFSGVNTTFDDVPMVNVNVSGLTLEERFFKRVMDIIFSLLGIIITLPIMFIVAIFIKLEDGGRIFFIQERYTINRKVFKVIKFRSMKENVENYSATDNDDRVTKVGRFIRKTRIDELPQFFNVLFGDMSLVGPRPEMIENVHKYESDLPEFSYRLKVKAGLTGIAQIEGKYNTTPNDKLLMDLTYIENYSFLTDLKIIFRTIIVVFKKDSTQAFESKGDHRE